MDNPDEQAVFRALDRATARNRALRQIGKTILAKQRAIRRVLTDEQWQDFVRLSDLLNTRHFEVLRLAIRIALRRGRQARPR